MVARHQAPRDARGLLGPLEYRVLQELWTRGSRSVRDVLSAINVHRTSEDELAYTTVMTVMVRLHEKGLLERTRRGRGYEYESLFDEVALVEHLSRQDVAELLDRYGVVAMSQFAVALQDADPETVRRIEELAKEMTDE